MKIHLQKSRIYVIITWLIVKRVDEVGNLRVSAPEKTALAVSGLCICRLPFASELVL